MSLKRPSTTSVIKSMFKDSPPKVFKRTSKVTPLNYNSSPKVSPKVSPNNNNWNPFSFSRKNKVGIEPPAKGGSRSKKSRTRRQRKKNRR